MDRKILKDKLGFILSQVSIFGLLWFGLKQNIDVSSPVVMIVASYVGGKAVQNVLISKAAAQDPSADTAAIVDKLEK